MHLLFTLLPLTGLARATSYTLQDDYGTGSTFFDKFNFFTQGDPTNGYVTYVDRSTAESSGLISTDSSIYMGVDHTNVATSGRSSVRISSQTAYDHGLFILDLAHMPGGICGTWPAYWLLGSGTWPSNGEIDIIEGVHDQTRNAMAGHTSDGCSIDSTGFTGSASTTNCYVSAAGQSANAGCGITDASSQSYGAGFNSAGGGVYATEWTSDAISIWFFSRGSVPADVTAGQPNPSSWGQPSARFAGSCNIDEHFKGMQIVFDTTFCGDWAGATWGSTSCASLASTCQDYVANQPGAFKDAYWTINSLKVYQQGSSAKRRAAVPQSSRPEFVKMHRRHGHGV